MCPSAVSLIWPVTSISLGPELSAWGRQHSPSVAWTYFGELRRCWCSLVYLVLSIPRELSRTSLCPDKTLTRKAATHGCCNLVPRELGGGRKCGGRGAKAQAGSLPCGCFRHPNPTPIPWALKPPTARQYLLRLQSWYGDSYRAGQGLSQARWGKQLSICLKTLIGLCVLMLLGYHRPHPSLALFW